MADKSAFDHPFDTPWSSGLRFLTEIIVWVSCAWAAGQRSVWLAIPVLVVLIGLPSIFSTPGDKKQIVLATPGPLRVLLELALYGVGVACVWAVWPTWLAIIATLIVLAALALGIPRIKWLLRGAPKTSS